VTIIGVDPGTTKSAAVWLIDGNISDYMDAENRVVRGALWATVDKETVCAIERIASYGMAVGADVFETCVWTGRFMQVWADEQGSEAHRITRKEIVVHLCGSPRAKDANVRQALIDRWGAPGTKKNPGPTYGITGDMWSALAVATVAMDRIKAGMPVEAK
jgi:hypothetical protein